jgi:hypothetical protein
MKQEDGKYSWIIKAGQYAALDDDNEVYKVETLTHNLTPFGQQLFDLGLQPMHKGFYIMTQIGEEQTSLPVYHENSLLQTSRNTDRY